MYSSLEFNVAQFLKSPVGATRTYELDLPPRTFDALSLIEGSRGRLQLVRLERSILATLSLAAKVEQECSRCLDSYQHPLRIEFDEQFYPSMDVETGRALEVPDAPNTFAIDMDHVLDLTEAIRQYLVLGLPMHPLCTESCPGLCPSCGHNLNEGVCACAEEPVASPFAVLRTLLK